MSAPIELVVLAILDGWLALRGSSASLRVIAGIGILLAVFGLHPFVGDLGSKGPKESVPDLLIIMASLGMAITSYQVLRSRRISRGLGASAPSR